MNFTGNSVIRPMNKNFQAHARSRYMNEFHLFFLYGPQIRDQPPRMKIIHLASIHLNTRLKLGVVHFPVAFDFLYSSPIELLPLEIWHHLLELGGSWGVCPDNLSFIVVFFIVDRVGTAPGHRIVYLLGSTAAVFV